MFKCENRLELSERKGEKMKRLVALFVVAVMSMSFTGCGAFGGAADDPTTITWWVGSWKYEDGRAQRIVGEFEEANPNIRVNITPVAWDGMRDMMLSALIAGQGPDVMNLTNAWATVFAATGSLSDVSSIIDEIGRDRFYEEALGWGVYNGVEYAVPYRNDTQVLFYNRTLFQEAGLSGPPTTLAELSSYAASLTGDGVYGIAFPLLATDHNAGASFRYILRAFGGDFISEDQTTATLTTTQAMDAYHYYMELLESMPPDVLAINNDDTSILFAAGITAMDIAGPWRIPTAEEGGIDFGLAVLPGLTQQDGTWFTGGWCMAIPNFSDHQEEAAEFVKFLLQTDVNAEITDALPAIREASTHERFQDEHTQVYLQQLNHMHHVFTLSTSAAIYETVAVGLQRMFMGEDIETVAEEINQEVQLLIEQAE